jgi:hypothetical protein
MTALILTHLCLGAAVTATVALALALAAVPVLTWRMPGGTPAADAQPSDEQGVSWALRRASGMGQHSHL